ncbi:MAG: hypothetical protein GX075_13700 [Firmicutes bacterium]|nr:hypothetical protein [Bacillota bacterium]
MDLNLIRKLEPKEKKCIEQQLTPETSFLPLIDNWKKLKAESEKICETRILDYDCEMFQKKDDPEHVFWLTKDTGILLREEMEFENGKHISIAKELNFEILDDSLFEIPNDYTILKLKLSTDEDLQKAPPLTMQNVQEFLLKGLHIVFLIKEENLELLSANKTQLLKESILTGMDFKEVTYTEINEKEAIKSNPQFLITTDNNIAFLIYDIATGYLYIRKKDIYQKNEADHYYDEKWRNKFLMGGYKIKLSEEFRQIID